MQVQRYSLLRTAGLLVSATVSFSSLCAAPTQPSADKDALPNFENSLTIGGQGNWAKGDKAAFQAESATAKNGFAGIEDFQFSKDLKNDFALKSDGHAFVGNNDYLAHLNLSKNELGSIDAGFKRFRTYYDNTGGFFLPTDNSWLPVFPRDLHVDRSKFWLEANINVPNAPVVTLRYTNELRNGRKDTTVWGASDFTGMSVPSNGNANQVSRYIAPGYLELGERHQTLEGLAKHTIGKTTIELSVTGDRVNNLDTRVGNRYPGQVKYPAILATPVTVIDPSIIWRFNNQAVAYDTLNNKANTIASTAKIETALSENAKIHAAVSYSLLNSDFTEERPIITQTPYGTPAVGVVPVATAQVQGLIGGARIKTYTATLGADFKVGHDLTIETGLKGEDRYCKAAETANAITATAPTATGTYTQTVTPNSADSRTKESGLTPELSLRYTGIKDISLYGTAEYRYVSGDERVTNLHANTATITSSNSAFNDVHENHGGYTVGANWVPCNFFTLRGETFYKDHQNNFQGYYWAPSSQFVLGYQLRGARITASVKPTPTLAFTTRYIYQTGKMQTATEALAEYQSMDAKSHNIGETIDWTPVKQFYMQANLNLVYDVTSTSYPRAGVTATSGGDDAVHNANNNYWNGSVLAGFVVDKVTNAELQYTYYKAANYEAALITSGLPYGAGQTDYTVTVGLKRKLTDKLLAVAKVGYLSSESVTTGGRANYTARIAYVSLQQAF